MNVQQTILRGIRGQLFNHDYLVIPGFGGFVLKPYPSQYSAGGTQLLPPSKTVTFNSQLKQNDGILAQWLQKELDCTVNEALIHINEFTEYCSSILQTRRRLSFEGVGFFFLDFENNLGFEPQHEENFLAASFGLGPVSLPPVQQSSEPVRETISFIDRTATVLPTAQQKQKRYNLRQVAAVLGIFAFLSLFLVLIAGNTFSNGYMNASVFESGLHSSYRSVKYDKIILEKNSTAPAPYVADANGIAHIKVREKMIAVQAIAGGEDSHLSVHTGKYEMVFGCFAVKQNAGRLIKKLARRKINAHISGTNSKGMFVVSSGNFSDKDEAIMHLARVKDLYPNTWIRQKN